MKVYFISGLGADSRVFRHIKLDQAFEPVFLDWIPPVKNESLSDYAIRLAVRIDQTEKFALIGLSLGGMIATEISRKTNPVITIIVSSIPTSDQLPPHFKFAYKLRLHRMVPIGLIKNATIIKRFFTLETKDDKAILRQVIKDSDPHFIRWAMNAILEWKNSEIPACICHIHGSKDEILPLKYTRPTYTIQSGTHMLIMTRAAELNEIINKTINQAIN